MSVPAAYLAVIIIWSTTPLAIKWSGEGTGFVAGVTGRMLIGTVLCLLLIRILRVRMPWDKQARAVYMAGALAVYGAMMCVYWGAQYISSGLVSVVFGLTPLVTSLIAVLLGEEQLPGPLRLAGIAFALFGLVTIFGAGSHIELSAVYGILAMIGAVALHSLSTVLVKRSAHTLPALAVTAGSLSVALPMYLLTWLLIDGTIPVVFPARTGASIIYLGIFGSVVGYVLYFYALKHVSASRMSLITLVTPVTALLLGAYLNNEHIQAGVWMGAALIMLGLILHEWGNRMQLSRQQVGADN